MLILFHSSVVALNTISIWYDQKYVDVPYPSEDYAVMPCKARPVFLTFWCLVLQTVYFTIALLNDIIGTNATNPKRPPLIRKIKDLLFSLAFPVATYVTAAFWGLYSINKDYILPDEIEKNIPPWCNHVWHTFVFVFIVLELLFTKRNYPSRNVGMTAATLFNIGYLCILVPAYLYTRIWIYPFLNTISGPWIAIYFLISAGINYVLYLLGEQLDKLSSSTNKIKKSSVKSH